MRRSLTPLLLVLAMAGSLLIATPGGASVPDKPFTQTLCEGDSDSIARLYTAGLGRQPEQGGFDFWVTEYTLGTWTFPRMAEFFVNSPEFNESYGTLDQDSFIRQLYRNILGREGEVGGVTFWNEQMTAGMTRATVLMRFAESPENIEISGTTPPTLGDFNEGRPEGPWRCGPSVIDSLLQLGDLPAGTIIDNNFRLRFPAAGDTSCDARFTYPRTTELLGFDPNPAGFFLLAQTAYLAPTTHGAERVMEQMRQALADCASYTDANGATVTTTELSMTSHGDDFVAIDLRSNGVFFSLYSHIALIRDGSVVTAVQLVSDSPIDIATTEQYAAILAERTAALPLDR